MIKKPGFTKIMSSFQGFAQIRGTMPFSCSAEHALWRVCGTEATQNRPFCDSVGKLRAGTTNNTNNTKRYKVSAILIEFNENTRIP
jgi:CDGSH-type Zn-finger protein